MRKLRPVIVLATWPEQPEAAYFGDREYAKWGDCDCDSLKLKFRALDPAPETGGYLDSDTRDAVSNLGLWLWFDKSGRLSIEARMFEIHSMTLRQAEANLKLLRWACAKLDKLQENLTHYQVSGAGPALLVVLEALGVKRAIEYRRGHGTDEFIPVAVALGRIAGHTLTRWKRLNPEAMA